MPIKFKSSMFHQKILDPNNNFQPALIPLEVRRDTLTGHAAVIQEFRFRSKMPKPDYSFLIEKTRPICPFCSPGVDENSPRFPPEFIKEGKLEKYGVLVIPNFNPYATYSAISILSRNHFTEITQFSENIIVNGLLASQEYLRRVRSFDPKARYLSVNWNYLPPAGGSVIHPHFQPVAAYIRNTYMKETLSASKRYMLRNGVTYWSDLVKTEKEKGERFIGETGGVSWLVNYAGRGREPDILGIFEKKGSILELTAADFKDYFNGLSRIFRYMTDNNYMSFNLCIYSAPAGQDHYRTHARLRLRFQFPILGTADACFIEALHDDFLCQTFPEAACGEIKKYFI
ncbi:MAG: hypothetical protein U1D67_02070 [Dehalococcoidia bacterium]|nr:hypothetical protein [Dehalococcoidia bacterium]MDZ4245884.1 hypothetical protein [Dehalococcoidia bacterium]